MKERLPRELCGFGVRLVAMTMSHVDGLLEAARDARIWTHLPIRAPSSVAVMTRIVEDAIVGRDGGREWPFVTFADGRIVGSTRFLDIRPAHRGLEIGWTWLSPGVQRTHVNTACKRLLLAACFEELGIERVQLKTDIRNEQSQRAIERLGATREGVLRHHMLRPDGTWRDSIMYSLVASEWLAVKAKLDAALDG